MDDERQLSASVTVFDAHSSR